MEGRNGGRPIGTDGSDYAYRMTVESRFKRVVRAKLLLRKYLTAQGLVLVFIALWALLFFGGEAPPATVASCVAGGTAVMIGTIGVKWSSRKLLRVYILATIVAVSVSLVPVLTGEIGTHLRGNWELYTRTHNLKPFAVVTIQAAQVFFATAVQLLAVSAALSLIPHLALKKATRS